MVFDPADENASALLSSKRGSGPRQKCKLLGSRRATEDRVAMRESPEAFDHRIVAHRGRDRARASEITPEAVEEAQRLPLRRDVFSMPEGQVDKPTLHREENSVEPTRDQRARHLARQWVSGERA